MGLFGLPAEVLTGMATGSSAAFFITYELSDESAAAKFCFENRVRRVATCITAATIIGATCGPIAGLMSEIIIYPAACYKTHKIQKKLKAATKGLKNNESTYVAYNGDIVSVKKKQPSQWAFATSH